jgi:uncharacterized protein (TIGR02118 family)
MYKVRATYLPRKDMRFDMDYYLREHVPLAKARTAGKLNISRIEVEAGATLLMEPGERCSPCVFCLYFASREDVEAFRHFLNSTDTELLRQDVPRYTNCELEWTVCEVNEV